MGKTNKILDLYGLPGVGKTTISNIVLSPTENNATKISGLMSEYHKESIFFKIIHLPLIEWWFLSLFLISVPGKNKIGKNEFTTFYYIVLAYVYFKHQKKYKYLVVDHGLIQQLASLLHNNSFHISDRSLRLFCGFIARLDSLTKIYCVATKEIALQRMKNRNRSVGRLDAIMNETSKVIDLLEKEEKLFNIVTERLSSPIIINMVQDTNCLSESIMSLLNN